MEGSIQLQEAERKSLLDVYRRHSDPAVCRRAHIVLLLAAGHSWATIAAVLFCSTRTIAQWKRRFQEGGLAALYGKRRGPREWLGLRWASVVIVWVRDRLPRDFGFLRSRWCCQLVAVLLLEIHQVRVSPETVRRWLHQGNLVWRRPRPVLGPKDPEREAKLKAIRRVLAHLPPDEVAVFEDEVDVNTNPKIGAMWMVRGQQAQVETPGTNEKRYLAGSLNWRTGALIVTEGAKGQGRNAALFVQHLDDLRWHLRRYRKIHVICDNAKFHKCRLVWEYLAVHGDRIVLHFLPKYSPESNPIERIWWKLHEEITRNHRCRDMEELLDLVFGWIENRNRFEVEDYVYFPKKAA